MLISCENVSLGYDGQTVIRGLNFTVQRGEYIWVVGENGSGKTTFIKGILGLIDPIEGNIVFCDEHARDRIGYLSQQSVQKKDFPAGVYEIVLSGNLSNMGLRPFYNSAEKKLTEEAMASLGIRELKDRCYRELSGGQQRRVLLARALCAAQAGNRGTAKAGKAPDTSCQILVLDEPASGLDPLVTAEVYELLRMLNQKMGVTIIMVSHDTRAAKEYAGRILHIENGKCFFGETAEYLQTEQGKKFFDYSREKNDGR